MFNKGDRVKIIKDDPFWKDKTGSIIRIATDDYLKASEIFVKIKFDEKDIIEVFNENDLEKISLEESLNQNINYIKDYIYGKNSDDEKIPTWFFINRICSLENKKEEEVIKDCKKFNYKVFCIKGPNLNKLVVAAPRVKEKDILEDYGDFILGKAKIEEVK